MRKTTAVLIAVAITVILSALLVSQADAKPRTFDQRATAHIRTGGTIGTQGLSKWELYKYKTVTLPKKYPFCLAPWESHVAIDRLVTVSAIRDRNTLTIEPELYRTVQPIAEQNRAKAKTILRTYKVRGKGRPAVKTIRRYVRTGRYIVGVKSAGDFFDQHGGDCAAHAAALYVLCKVQGIPVRYAIGRGLKGGLHAWNRVKYGHRWYWVDETWGISPARKLWDGYCVMEYW